jgi:hypothetical protein
VPMATTRRPHLRALGDPACPAPGAHCEASFARWSPDRRPVATTVRRVPGGPRITGSGVIEFCPGRGRAADLRDHQPRSSPRWDGDQCRWARDVGGAGSLRTCGSRTSLSPPAWQALPPPGRCCSKLVARGRRTPEKFVSHQVHGRHHPGRLGHPRSRNRESRDRESRDRESRDREKALKVIIAR